MKNLYFLLLRRVTRLGNSAQNETLSVGSNMLTYLHERS
jgi:hypothetical protein